MKKMKIEILTEVLPTMCGNVVYHTKPCPHGVNGMLAKGQTATVGSTSCKMCQHFGGIEDATRQVICNHE